MTDKLDLAKKEKFKINLFDLDDKRFYIKINKTLLGNIKRKIITEFGGIIPFSKEIKANSQSLYGWFYKETFPLSIIKKISSKLNLSCNLISNNLVSVRSGIYPFTGGGNLSKPIRPTFPMRLTEELARIMAHLFGDGHVTVNKKKHLSIAYYNQDKFLLHQFKEDIKNAFGLNYLKTGINKTTPYILLPTPIGLILITKICSFGSKDSRIPHFIKYANKEIKIEFLRCFFDDESHVAYRPPHRYIELSLSNKSFVEDLVEMITEFGIVISKVYHKNIRGFDSFYFYIRGYYNLKKYRDIIGFYSPNKRRQLEKIMGDPGRKHYSHGETKSKIVSLLKGRILTSSQIAKKLERKLCTINHFLKILEKERKIKYLKKKGKSKIYEVK